MCGNGFNSFYIPERQGVIILRDNVCSESTYVLHVFMNKKFLNGVLLCRKAVSFYHFVIQIPEKVHTGSTVAEQALRQSMMAVPALISRW